MKEWIISVLAGPLGSIVRPVVSAVLGTLIGLIYEQSWIAIYKVGWLRFLIQRIIAQIPDDVVQSLTPMAVGTTCAVMLWTFASGWVIAKMKAGNRQIQVTLNATPAAQNVKVDGLILRNGETATSVSRLAYEVLYPTDTSTRGGDGVPEIRRPLP